MTYEIYNVLTDETIGEVYDAKDALWFKDAYERDHHHDEGFIAIRQKMVIIQANQ